MPGTFQRPVANYVMTQIGERISKIFSIDLLMLGAFFIINPSFGELANL